MGTELNGVLLGKSGVGNDAYNPTILFRIPRKENREKHGIKGGILGYDIWNCYEVSFMTPNYLPINGVLKISYPASTEYIVESKSLKLYLNGFNMYPFGGHLRPIDKVIDSFVKIVKRDLINLLECNDVQISFFEEKESKNYKTVFEYYEYYGDLLTQIPDYQTLVFEHWNEKPELLVENLKKVNKGAVYTFSTDLIRSNCRVTNQPDFGNLYVYVSCGYDIPFENFLKYILSFRKENHFHEEVVEMIYQRFQDAFTPEKLMVYAKYTRRGGIDINPIRYNDTSFCLADSLNASPPFKKSFRQ